ncbi:hypothetical protein NESM_000080300 [Novymonas esmeraldas]|uniref:Uncharacterized protein n=1 Tax=Novymonas esmeraldas TaxID=1808958 RepID=A0AAW0F244_9TRYP
MGGAVSKRQLSAGSGHLHPRPQRQERHRLVHDAEGSAAEAPYMLPRLVSASSSFPPVLPVSPASKEEVSPATAPRYLKAYVDIPDQHHPTHHKRAEPPAALRHFVRRPIPSSSSSLSNQTSMPTPASTVATRAAEPAVPAPAPAAAAEVSPESSCSAFSLYSAESSTHEAPALPPPPPPAMERVALLRAPAVSPSGAAVTVAVTVSTPPSHASTIPAILTHRSSLLSSASPSLRPSATFSGMPALPGSAAASASRLPRDSDTQRHPSSSTSAGDIASGAQHDTSENDSMQMPPMNPLLSSSVTAAAAAAAHIVSSALLDLSFDSRAFAVNEAVTTSEIQRLGIRLRELQHEHEQGVARRASAVTQPRSSVDSTASRTHDRARDVARALGLPHPGSSLGSLESTPATTALSPTERGLARTHVYAETVKFVSLIQEMHEERTAGRASYTWFRWGATPPSTSIGSGATFDETGPTSSVVSPRVQGTHSPQSTRRDSAVTGAAASGVLNRSSLRRRDRQSMRVQWVPFEMLETDSQPSSVATPECFCGYHATGVLADGVSATHGHERSPVIDMDLAVSERQPPLEPRVGPVGHSSTFDTPPLPSVPSSSGRPSTLVADGDKENANLLNLSGGPLTSSVGSTISASARSFSNDSLSFCPVHVAHRPVSILLSSTSTTESVSLSRRQVAEPPQVEVPASSMTALPAIKAGASHLLPTATRRHTAGDADLSSSGRHRAIISTGVPHRSQLAKRALEDNRLFFEIHSQQKTVP